MSFRGNTAESEHRSGAASGSPSVERINAACRSAAEGKLAARRIAAWLGGAEINEPEFRLLWLLAGTASVVLRFMLEARFWRYWAKYAHKRATLVAACWIPFGVAIATLVFLAVF